MLFYNLDTSESHWEKQIEFPFGKRRYNSKGDLWTGCSSVVALNWSILTIIFSVCNSKSGENNFVFFMKKKHLTLIKYICTYLTYVEWRCILYIIHSTITARSI